MMILMTIIKVLMIIMMVKLPKVTMHEPDLGANRVQFLAHPLWNKSHPPHDLHIHAGDQVPSSSSPSLSSPSLDS